MTTQTISTRGTRRRRRRIPPILPALSLLMIAAGSGLFLLELVTFSQREERLPEDLTVASVQVGGLLPAQAVARWEQVYAEPITLYYGESPILLDPAAIGFRTNRDTMLAEAEAAGESEGGFWIRFFNYLSQQELQQSAEVPLYAEYQRSLLQNFLQDIAQRYDRSSGTAGYDVATLTTFSGDMGRQLDIPASIDLIDAALRSPTERTVRLPIGDSDASRPRLETLERLIVDYLDSQNFIYDGQSTVASVFILDLETGEEINLLGDVAFSAASTMKLPILIDYYRYLTLPPTQEEAWLMANSLLCSRNSSSNLLMQISGGGVDVFQGIANVTRTAQYLGARNTYLTAPFISGDPNQVLGSIAAPPTTPNPNYNTAPDQFNQTTTEDLGTLLALTYDCATYGSGLMSAYPAGEFTQNECRQMLELMSGNDLLRLLQGGLPAGTRISHKNGWLSDRALVGDAGIVYPPNGRDYVIAVFLWENVPFPNFERLWPLVEGISRATWNFFVPEAAMLTPRSDLPPTAQECEGNYLPPDAASLNLDDTDAWRSQ
jgi:beta-lactamase class A